LAIDKTGSLPVSFRVQIIYRIVSYRIQIRFVIMFMFTTSPQKKI